MNAFFWTAGHLGWGIFLALVYSFACVLVGDFVWRLVTVRGRTLLAALGAIWVLGIVVIVAAMH